ncbi:MAG: LemA family protein [Candidatus ainarchaeum sp.]|nr:LemA family protein [Candidatus ainarchaeum sp.]
MLEWILLFVIIVFVLGVLLYVWSTYNRLITLKERIKNSWAQIDVQLKRRFDLIPNLVETVKGYAKHEKGTLEEITKLRGGLVKGSPEQRAEADALLGSALGKLMVVVENYPQLKANENFLKLQQELSGTEDKISFVRTAYNDSVYIYNMLTKRFPSSIIANFFKFTEEGYFEIPEAQKEQRENVKVKF